MIRQCCMHWTSVKCVQDQACQYRSAKCICTSGFSPEKCCNKGPTRTPPPGGRPRAPTALSLNTRMNQNIKEAHESAPILCKDIPRSYFTQTSQSYHPTSSRTDRSGPPYRLVPKIPTHTKRSSRPPPPTPPHQRQSGVAK